MAQFCYLRVYLGIELVSKSGHRLKVEKKNRPPFLFSSFNAMPAKKSAKPGEGRIDLKQ